MPKPEVRRAAAELGLAIAEKPDSQDICFVPEGRYTTVIDRIRPQGAVPGEIVHLDGRVLGRHEGVTRYTIGQRRGLNVAVGDPLYVVKIDAEAKQVIVGPREALLTSGIILKEINWLGNHLNVDDAASETLAVLARVRSTAEPVVARLSRQGLDIAVMFDVPEHGVSPGQACVLYDPEHPDRLLGGGFIDRTLSV
jgi:tRNA-specific 2-thiouridylase